MPDDLESLTDEQHANSDEDSPPFKLLREQRDTATEEAKAAKRELVLHKAGLGDLTDKQMKALQAAHEGDWDAESLKATATELNFVQPSEAEQQKVPQAEQEAMQRVAQASQGEPPAAPVDLDAKMEAAKEDPEELKNILRDAGILVDEQ